MSALDQTHLLAQRALRGAVGAQVAGMLASVTLDRDATIRAAYATAASRLIASGQQQAGRLGLAYVAALAPPVRPPNLARALDEILVRPDSAAAIVGLVRFWSLLDDGLDEPVARTEAASFAGGLAEENLHGAVRVGMDEGADAAEREPRYRLELAPGACDWCHFIASTGERYLSAESVPVPHGPSNPKHRGGVCNCTPAIEFEEVGITPAPERRYAHGRTIREPESE